MTMYDKLVQEASEVLEQVPEVLSEIHSLEAEYKQIPNWCFRKQNRNIRARNELIARIDVHLKQVDALHAKALATLGQS